jgi:DNA-binding CsgD family transcriptional regulator
VSSTPLGEDDLALLRCLAEGSSVESAARRTSVSERTVRRRLNRICRRLGVKTPIEAVVWAVRRGLVCSAQRRTRRVMMSTSRSKWGSVRTGDPPPGATAGAVAPTSLDSFQVRSQ